MRQEQECSAVPADGELPQDEKLRGRVPGLRYGLRTRYWRYISMRSLFSKTPREQAGSAFSTRDIALAGLFAALYIALSFFNIRLSPMIEIRFPFLVLAAAGMYGGPLFAVAVAVVSDVASTLLTGGAFFFGFTFSYSLMACLFGLLYYRQRLSVPRALAGAAVEWCISLSLHTLWLSLMYGTPYRALFITRLAKCSVMFFVNAVLLHLVLHAFRRIFTALHLSEGT